MSYKVIYSDNIKSYYAYDTMKQAVNVANRHCYYENLTYRIIYSAPDSWQKACRRFIKNVMKFLYTNHYPFPTWETKVRERRLHTLHTQEVTKVMCKLKSSSCQQEAEGFTVQHPDDEYIPVIGRAISLCRAMYGQYCDYKNIIGLEDNEDDKEH